MTDPLALRGGYAAWRSWLEAFARGEDLPATHLEPVDERMGPHMQGRLLEHLGRAYEARAGLWGDRLQRDLDHAATAGGHAAALVDARARLAPLVRFAASPLLPEQVRTALRTSLENMVDSAQQSLEDSAKRGSSASAVSSGLLGVVRDNALRAALRPAAMPPPLPSPTTPAAPRGRRVIL